jgi:hypothetical protein
MRRVSVANTFTANTAAVISEVFRAPTQDSVVESIEGKKREPGALGMPAPQGPPEPAKETEVRSYFKMIFLSVLFLTVGTLLAEIMMVWTWISPTTGQQNLITGMESVWKGGVGAILGLLGGKVT